MENVNFQLILKFLHLLTILPCFPAPFMFPYLNQNTEWKKKMETKTATECGAYSINSISKPETFLYVSRHLYGTCLIKAIIITVARISCSILACYRRLQLPRCNFLDELFLNFHLPFQMIKVISTIYIQVPFYESVV